uniref:CCHC-type domain-containing protein n=1 Tax=Tanacetum cinerariifolium TaxID=118510 RepID=A0A6L2JTY6_TANCI|nr:hypothetical protein [Tanacetum cinerariifolium]
MKEVSTYEERQKEYDNKTQELEHLKKMVLMLEKVTPKKRTTRASPATTTTTTTPVTNTQLKVLINQGVADALAARDADRSMNGDDNHNLGWGTEGVVGLMQWFEKIKTVFHISNCTAACQIKFVAYTLQGIVLTWWNSHVKTVTHDVAYAMTCKTLKKMMTDKYCPRGEIKKLEIEMWNLKVKESDEIDKYVDGLPDMIHKSVMESKPKTMQDAIEFATKLMDKKISTLAKRQAENKRKLDNNNLPRSKCTIKCANCKRVGHLTQECRSPATTNNQRNLTCYECKNQWHYRSDCLELKNRNHRNQAGGTEARGMVHALGGGETNQDLNNMEDDINA